MALSGNQVTQLWPYGSSGHRYGDFSGKAEQEEPEPADSSNLFLTFPWVWDEWRVT
jgi:hypothetical protein